MNANDSNLIWALVALVALATGLLIAGFMYVRHVVSSKIEAGGAALIMRELALLKRDLTAKQKAAADAEETAKEAADELNALKGRIAALTFPAPVAVAASVGPTTGTPAAPTETQPGGAAG